MSMIVKPKVEVEPSKFEYIESSKFGDIQPFHWEFEEIESGLIKATNAISGESFEGSMIDFNTRMRK
jgi:hypothetical protein